MSWPPDLADLPFIVQSLALIQTTEQQRKTKRSEEGDKGGGGGGGGVGGGGRKQCECTSADDMQKCIHNFDRHKVIVAAMTASTTPKPETKPQHEA